MLWIPLMVFGISLSVMGSVEASFKQYQAGDVIIEEGYGTEEVFVLIDGEARAFSEGVEVGKIHPGEFLGEISFLTDTVCSATVILSEASLVQVIRKDNFAKIIRSRPETMIQLSTTLAERLLRANTQTVKQKNSAG